MKKPTLSNFNRSKEEYEDSEKHGSMLDKENYLLKNTKIFLDPYEQVKRAINNQSPRNRWGKETTRPPRYYSEHLDFGELYNREHANEENRRRFARDFNPLTNKMPTITSPALFNGQRLRAIGSTDATTAHLAAESALT